MRNPPLQAQFDERMWWITPEPVIGPRFARTRWAYPPNASPFRVKNATASENAGNICLRKSVANIQQAAGILLYPKKN
jgi:hypothetical protein